MLDIFNTAFCTVLLTKSEICGEIPLLLTYVSEAALSALTSLLLFITFLLRFDVEFEFWFEVWLIDELMEFLSGMAGSWGGNDLFTEANSSLGKELTLFYLFLC